MACPLTVIWAAAIGASVVYELEIDGQIIRDIGTNSYVTCIEGEGVHTLKVTAIHLKPDGTSGRSLSSANTGTLLQLAPPGASPTATPTATPTEEPSDLPPAVVCADLDQDGVIGYPDFVIFSSHYGTTHDGSWEPNCP